MPLLAYTECLFSEIPEDSYAERLFDCSTDMSKDDIRIDFLCILRAHCLKYLSTAISGSATDLLKSIINMLEENNDTNDTEKDKIKTLQAGYSVLQQLEHEALLFFNQPDCHIRLRCCYYDIKEILIYFKKSSESSTVRMIAEGEKYQVNISGQLIIKLTSEKHEIFFDGIKQLFELMINHSRQYKKLTNNFWMNREPHNENKCTILFAELLGISLCVFPGILNIIMQTKCGDGICDFLLHNETLQIPVEAKSSSHPELWSAIENQLIEKYLVYIPYGIYLVYWFGPKFLKKPPKNWGISTPNSAEELKKMLHEHTVLDEHKERIAVFCIDCSA